MDLIYNYHCFQWKLETIHGILVADIETGFGTAATLSPFQACVLDKHSALCFCTSHMLGYFIKLTTPLISISWTFQPPILNLSPHPKKSTAKATGKWLIPMILSGLGSFQGFLNLPNARKYFPLIFLVRNSCKSCRWLRYFLICFVSVILLVFPTYLKKTNAQTIWKKSLNQAETNPCHVFLCFFAMKAGHERAK